MLTLVSNPSGNGATLSFQFTVAGTITPFLLDSSTNPNGPWSTENGANFSGPTAGRYTVTFPSNGNVRFYRVRAN